MGVIFVYTAWTIFHIYLRAIVWAGPMEANTGPRDWILLYIWDSHTYWYSFIFHHTIALAAYIKFLHIGYVLRGKEYRTAKPWIKYNKGNVTL